MSQQTASLPLGHEAIGLDGAARFVDMARHHTGCEVLHQDFLALDLPAAHFDGVFPNASLFHVPAQELPRVLGELRATLRPREKTLYLGLGKTGQISAKAVEHPRLKKLVDPARSRSS